MLFILIYPKALNTIATSSIRLDSGHVFFFEKSVYAFPVGLVHYLRDSQTFFFNKIFIKNQSYDIIYTFKIYFVTVFSVFSNKRYLN